MRRREFIALLGVAASPLGARAQQSKTFPRIGILFANKGGLAHALFASLAARGYVDGKTAHLLARDAEGRLEQLPQLARELVGLRVEVIIAVAAAATLAARNATTTIPIVMAHAGDPIGSGLIESLSHPGGNVTGTTSFAPEIVAKSIELLRELVPHASRLGMLIVPSNTGSPLGVREAQVAAARLGLELHIAGVERSDDLDSAFRTIEDSNADSLHVFAEPMLFANRRRVLEFAASRRLPAIYLIGGMARDGGLIAYSPLFEAHYPRVAEYVDKILRGANPADLPVEQSARFELVLNLKTAKALGLTIPPTLLARADEVIE